MSQRKMRPHRNLWDCVEHKLRYTYSTSLSRGTGCSVKREDFYFFFFAATNVSSYFTAGAFSSQVCVAAAAGTPRTRERFFLFCFLFFTGESHRKSAHAFKIKPIRML